jgi:hypothetical protein
MTAKKIDFNKKSLMTGIVLLDEYEKSLYLKDKVITDEIKASLLNQC